MLKRELVKVLCLRIRIVATKEIKMKVTERYGFGQTEKIDNEGGGDDDETKEKFERSSIDKDGDRMTGGTYLNISICNRGIYMQSRFWSLKSLLRAIPRPRSITPLSPP